MTVEAGSTGPKTTSAEGAVAKPGSGLLGSTFLRHAALMLLAFVGILLLLQAIDPFRASQLGEMAYFIPAVAGLTVLTGLNGQISLGHGALMAVGAYTTALMLDEREGLGVPFGGRVAVREVQTPVCAGHGSAFRARGRRRGGLPLTCGCS